LTTLEWEYIIVKIFALYPQGCQLYPHSLGEPSGVLVTVLEKAHDMLLYSFVFFKKNLVFFLGFHHLLINASIAIPTHFGNSTSMFPRHRF